jgi:hypothetical protein
MLFCRIHSMLFIGTLQKWVPYPHEDLKSLQASIIEGCCSICVEEAKESLRVQFPALYAHATKVSSVS